ncbi:hypothetical protein [Deinococcus multiflagellatus]|uniref:hypothetical protein n=1 Tax=Deinococcus multiflagellatus TaxID=1656887 RepID=UPI0036D34A13
MVVPAGVTTSAALLARLPEDAALAELRALLTKDTQSAFPLQVLQGQGDLWTVPQAQPVRVRPSPD